MFARKTVFVVGAGGSYEVGLPVGDGLKAKISNKLQIAFEQNNVIAGDPTIATIILRTARERLRNPNDFFLAGRQIAAAMPQAISIDNFLHTHAANDDIVLMGKLAIAASILDAERTSSLVIDKYIQTIDFGGYPENLE